MSTQNICNICGANYEYRNGRWVCPACGAYKPEELSNEEVTLLYNAAQKLRFADFDEAEKAYDDIVRKYPSNHAGYWGRLLSRFGIKYEDDFDGRKIPTCYATSIESVILDKDYEKALELADEETKKYYAGQAGYIEKIRLEWVAKAKKEKPYDIFICYKESDFANGIDRTKDSVAAQDLYIHLTSQGYRVFFSRESLRDKVGEKYEPYIFNALSTAKVMLVYGSSADYISSTWLKNEWTRFEKRIAVGEKKPNSLLVACDGFNPSELPKALSSMQCFDADKKSFYSDLDDTIKRIIKGEPKHKSKTEKKKSVAVSAGITVLLLVVILSVIFIPKLFANDQTETSQIIDSRYGVVISSSDKVFRSDTAVNVERYEFGLEYEAAQNAVSSFAKVELLSAKLFDIGCNVKLNKVMTIKVPFSKSKTDSKIKVFYVSDDSKNVEECNCTYDNSYVEFSTTHLSYYLVCEVMDDPITPASDITVSFDLNGGQGTIEPQTVKKGKSVTLPHFVGSKDKYSFIGWSVTKNGTVTYTDGAILNSISDDLVLFAVWEGNPRTVTLYGRDTASEKQIVHVKYGDVYSLPSCPFTKLGYTFDYWTNVLGKDEITAGSTVVINESVEYYAHFSSNENAVAFNANGGLGYMPNQSFLTDESKALNKCTFTRAGYIFAGWATTPGGKAAFADEAIYQMGASSTVLYATWAKASYTITYVLNGGSNHLENPVGYDITSSPINLKTPTKPGYSFVGWFSDENFLVASSSIPTGSEGNKTFYASWTINTNKLHYSANATNATGIMSDSLIQTNESIKLPANEFNRPGYTFMGWSTAANGTLDYYDQSSYKMGTASEYTLYAIWQLENYTIIYNLDGGSNSESNPASYTILGNTITLSNPTKTGYIFTGWAEGNTIAKGSTGNKTFTAIWEAKQNTLTYNPNNGEGNMANQMIATDSTATLANNTFIRKGYTFAGWATSPSGTVAYKDTALYTMGTASEYTLYAVWNANTNAIVFHANSGSGNMENQAVKTGETAPLSAVTFTRTGYDFVGWATIEDGAKVYDNQAQYIMGTDSRYDLYALWTPTHYSIEYNLNGGTNAPQNPTVYTMFENVSLQSPVKEGYSFVGWSEGNTIPFGSNGTKSFTAIWEAKANVLILTDGTNQITLTGKTDELVRLPENTFTKENYEFAGWATEQNGEVVYFDRDLFLMGAKSSYTLYSIWKDRTGWISISTPEELVDISKELTKQYYLINDIDMSGIRWIPIGTRDTPFSGSFDGNNHIIYNLSCDTIKIGETTKKTIRNEHNSIAERSVTVVDTTHEYYYSTALFGTNEGVIENLYLVNANSYAQATATHRTGFSYWAYAHNFYDYYYSGDLLCSDNRGTVINCIGNGIIVFEPAPHEAQRIDSGQYWDYYTENSGTFENIVNGYQSDLISECDGWLQYSFTETENKRYQYSPNHSISQVPLFEIIRNGYSLAGWSLSKGGAVKYRPGDEVYIPYGQDRLILYPVWEPNKNEIIFNANGGNGAMSNQIIQTDATANLSSCLFAKTGYHFAGWSTTANGQVAFSNCDLYTMGKDTSYTLYAQWEPNTNNIIFDPNGGSGSMANQQALTNSTVSLNACAFNPPSGYYFAGWSDEPLRDAYYLDCSAFTVGTNAEYRLFAVWKEILIH